LREIGPESNRMTKRVEFNEAPRSKLQRILAKANKDAIKSLKKGEHKCV